MNQNTIEAALERLSSEDLIKNLEELTLKSEKKLNVKIILHLAEASKRKIHLDLGYPSLFTYCEEHLKLDPGIIWQRLQIANKCREYPQMLHYLLTGRLTLSVAAKLCAHMTPDNAEKILESCSHKSLRAVEDIVVSLKPRPVFSPMIRKQQASQAGLPFQPEQKKEVVVDMKTVARTIVKPATTEVYNFRFSGSRDLKEKLDRLGEVMGESALQAMDKIIEFAIDCAYQCEYRSLAGKRCTARTNLQIDHIVPFAKGGGHEADNFQVLCQGHNLRKAEKDFGEEFMREKLSVSSA